jgi:hypothetical protein
MRAQELREEDKRHNNIIEKERNRHEARVKEIWEEKEMTFLCDRASNIASLTREIESVRKSFIKKYLEFLDYALCQRLNLSTFEVGDGVNILYPDRKRSILLDLISLSDIEESDMEWISAFESHIESMEILENNKKFYNDRMTSTSYCILDDFFVCYNIHSNKYFKTDRLSNINAKCNSDDVGIIIDETGLVRALNKGDISSLNKMINNRDIIHHLLDKIEIKYKSKIRKERNMYESIVNDISKYLVTDKL